jgi:hypothetical protein
VNSTGHRVFFYDSQGNLHCFVPSDAAQHWHASGTINLDDGRAVQQILSKTKDGLWIRWFEDWHSPDKAKIEARILTDLEALCWFIDEELPTPDDLEQTVTALLSSQKPDAKTSEAIRQRRLAALPTATVSAYALRDLYSISYDYPSALSPVELRSLRDCLWQFFWNHLQLAGVDRIADLMYCPFTGTKGGESTIALYAGTLLTIHPDAEIEPSGKMSNATDILNSSLLAAPKPVRHAVDRIHEVAFLSCRWPDRADELACTSTSRRLHVAYQYWRAVARIVGIEASPNRFVGWRPHPLLPLIENLRLRLKDCMGPLLEEAESATICARIEALLDAVLTDPDVLDMDDFVSHEMSDVESYFARAKLQGRLTRHPLTRAEEIFFQFADQSTDKFQADFDAAQLDFKKRAQIIAAKRQGASSAGATPVQPVDTQQTGQPKRGQWAFLGEPAAGSRHRFGFVEGSLRDLAAWIGVDERTMKRNNGKSEYHIQFVHGTRYRAWFESQRRYAEVNQLRLAQETRKTQKKHKGA